MRIMLHACCGPCLLEPFDGLSATHEVRVVYANPNIHPRVEYERRRDTLLEYARESGIVVEEVAYEPESWTEAVRGLEDRPGRRCRACFRLRLGLAAARAAESGCDAIATTLSVSPYQDPDAIREAGEAAAAQHGIAFLVTDFRDRYAEASRRSRELGMYRQDFCGCRYSKDEAAAGRERRRSEKAARAIAKGGGARG
ncbi:MAG: epoxyqueuosine reductase QueH [Coriobacteriia bacterium]|nr:epoxyqueuosine reductase QueH [Coriobacteriia bacterium]